MPELGWDCFKDTTTGQPDVVEGKWVPGNAWKTLTVWSLRLRGELCSLQATVPGREEGRQLPRMERCLRGCF